MIAFGILEWYEPLADSGCNGFGTAFGIELCEYFADVKLDSVFADMEHLSYFFVRVTLSKVTENSLLASSQHLVRRNIKIGGGKESGDLLERTFVEQRESLE
jgi:hypothetical protein